MFAMGGELSHSYTKYLSNIAPSKPSNEGYTTHPFYAGDQEAWVGVEGEGKSEQVHRCPGRASAVQKASHCLEGGAAVDK